ncbi:hypothetical protein DEJ23_06000 [Curtobacterium sp. MCSS17_008]|nr:hypothetical protein DEJ23_06000 [Curtobacterium sp. MCSS17_008]
MYGSGSGIGPTIGGGSAAALAYTGSGSMVLPAVIASASLVLGILLALRNWMLTRSNQAA